MLLIAEGVFDGGYRACVGLEWRLGKTDGKAIATPTRRLNLADPKQAKEEAATGSGGGRIAIVGKPGGLGLVTNVGGLVDCLAVWNYRVPGSRPVSQS